MEGPCHQHLHQEWQEPLEERINQGARFGQNGQHGDVSEMLAPGHISSASVLYELLICNFSAWVNLGTFVYVLVWSVVKHDGCGELVIEVDLTQMPLPGS